MNVGNRFSVPYTRVMSQKWDVVPTTVANAFWLSNSSSGLAPNKRQAIIWTNDELIHRRTHASPNTNELSTMIPIAFSRKIALRLQADFVLICEV